MLQQLNERIQGMIAWIILGLVMVTFALFGLDYYMQSRQDKAVVVEVNGEPILEQTLALSARRSRQLRQVTTHAVQTETEKQLKMRVLNELIQNRVLLQAATQQGFYVSPTEATQAILSIPQFQTDGHFSSNRYAEALSGAFFTEAAFHEEVRQGMMMNQQRFAFMGTAFVLPQETDQFARAMLETRTYAYLQIPTQRFVAQQVVAEKAMETYYQAHQKRFLTPEQVSIEYIQLSLDAFQAKIQIPLADMKRYYEENQMKKPFDEVKAEIEAQLKMERAEQQYTKAVDALSDLSYQTPDTLAPVAHALHLPLQQTPLFTRAGGELPLTQQKRVIRAAFSQEVLQFENNSAPIHLTDHDVIVLRVHQRVPATIKPFAEVKQTIQTELAAQQAANAAKRLGVTLLQTLHAGTPLQDTHLQWVTVTAAKRDSDAVPEEMNTLAFQLTQQAPLRGRSLANGDYVIVRLISVTPGKASSLDPEQRAAMRQQLASNEGAIAYDLYLTTLMQQAKVRRI